MTMRRFLPYLGIAVLLLLPVTGIATRLAYFYHIMILILIWGGVYTSWSLNRPCTGRPTWCAGDAAAPRPS